MQSLPNKILSWMLTPIHIVFFFSILCFFHPFQIISSWLGRRAQLWVMERMCATLLWNMRLSGTRITFESVEPLPLDRPLIFVSNHQSMYDVPFIWWYLRKHLPRFISKKELAKGIPSISIGLRRLPSCLIDRRDPAQAIPAIEEFGRQCQLDKAMACIYPEGTRGRDGKMKKFKNGGLLALLRTMPDALIVPAVVDGSWKLLEHGFRPVPFGVKMQLKTLAPFDPKSIPVNEITPKVEALVREALDQLRR